MSRNIEGDFPNLRHQHYRITSPKATDYNCVAWAADDTNSWWWPDSQNQYYWPAGVPRAETLDGFIKAFESLAFKVCDSEEYEEDFEKVAIYTNEGKPTHTTRQINSRYWTSKLGSDYDITHDIGGVSGGCYGSIAVFMKRPKVH